MAKTKRADYGQKEKMLAKKYEFLHGQKLRSRSDKIFCKVCDYDNGVQCLYDILVANGEKPSTKYPCGKAYCLMTEKKKR